jgi:hypothetical protein
MKWVRIGQLTNYISISEQTVRKLMKENVFLEGKHYVKNPYIGHTLFNLEELETWLLQHSQGSSEALKLMQMKDW